jgi:hypothetical protein
MAITAEATFADIAPQFAADLRVANFIARAQTRISGFGEGTWSEDTRNEAVAYRAAHDMTIVSRNYSTGGQISTMREGDQSIGFAPIMGLPKWAAELGQTAYGMHLYEIICGNILPFGVTDLDD